MTTNTGKTVREFALELPSSINIFEKLGIDYCCGGQKPLSEACAAAGVNVENLAAKLEQLKAEQQARSDTGKNWMNEPLDELVAHITGAHHSYVRQQIPNLQALLDKVTEKHGANHPELESVRETFAALAEELGVHLMKEEQILFPYIVRSEEAGVQREPAPPACFGSVENPIRMMMSEHDNAGNALREMRKTTSNYSVPDDACTSFRALYKLLQEFEADLHQHIHLENNILFPRAIRSAGVAA